MRLGLHVSREPWHPAVGQMHFGMFATVKVILVFMHAFGDHLFILGDIAAVAEAGSAAVHQNFARSRMVGCVPIRVMNGLSAMVMMFDLHAAGKARLVRDVMAVWVHPAVGHVFTAHCVALFTAGRMVRHMPVWMMDRIAAVGVVMNHHAVLVVLDLNDVVAMGMNTAAASVFLFHAWAVRRLIFRKRRRRLVLLVSLDGIAEAEVFHLREVIAAFGLVKKVLTIFESLDRHGRLSFPFAGRKIATG